MTGPANDNGALNCGWSHIELSAGTVTEAYMLDGHIKRPLLNEIGKYRFFIDVVERDGGRLGLDSCETYEEAIQLAEEARIDCELTSPVRDRVVGDN